jgi:hypothetical protein
MLEGFYFCWTVNRLVSAKSVSLLLGSSSFSYSFGWYPNFSKIELVRLDVLIMKIIQNV